MAALGHGTAGSLGADASAVLALSLLPTIPGASVDVSATLTWRVENWRTTSGAIRSPHFMCGGTKWRLLCYPQGSPASLHQNSVSIYLDRGDFGKNTNLPPLCVQFSLVVSHPSNPSNYISRIMAKRIGLAEVLCGFDLFCTSDQVLQGAYGNISPIVNQGEADITVFLRIMEDPTGYLWMDGIPSEQPTTSPFSDDAAHTGQSMPSTSATAIIEAKPEKSLPPSRAAYPGEECMICADEPLLFPAKPPTALCSHESRICLLCLQSHIAAEFGDKGAVDGIACPAPDCTEMLDYHEIQFWADEDTFTRYDRALARRALGVDENFIMCTNAACGAGQIHSEGANAPIVTCYVCQHRTCFVHQITWHEGHLCVEWDQLQKTRMGIATNAEYLSKFTKPCPNCKKPIEKFMGCDSLICKPPAGCGHTFCWLCLAPFDAILRDGNHKHYPSCKYYVAYSDPVTATTTTLPPVILPYLASPAASAASIPTSVIGTSQPTSSAYSPPPYMASSAPSTSQGGKKWYRFWKGQ